MLAAKYEITQGKDGGDRIRAGTQRLNVSDFLTRELNLSWSEASGILRQCYASQIRGEPPSRPRVLPRAELWRQYVVERDAAVAAKRAGWAAQRESEASRRAQIREEFRATRSGISGDRSLRRPARATANSVARMTRAGQQLALTAAITRERSALRVATIPSFEDFVHQRAQAGDDLALGELRRMQRMGKAKPKLADEAVAMVKAAEPGTARNEIVWRTGGFSWNVLASGAVVYRRGQVDVVRDDADAVQVLSRDSDAIEVALRLAHARFGPVLDLSGSAELRLRAARLAAEAGLQVEFTDPGLNDVMNARRVELAGERLAQGRAPWPARRSQPGDSQQPESDAGGQKGPTL